MCVACGDISSTQATVSTLPTFLLAVSPLLFIVWYKVSRIIRIEYIVSAISHRQFLIIATVTQGLLVLLGFIAIHLWPFSLAVYVASGFATYLVVWGVVGYSFVQQPRSHVQVTLLSIYSSLGASILFFILFSIGRFVPEAGSIRVLQELTLYAFAGGMLLQFCMLHLLQQIRKQLKKRVG